MQVPTVTLEDLQAFQAKHFPSQQPSTFPPEHDETTEDDLGYYPDGVKRTLTDEEIQIFRHSEIHALLRQRQRQQEEAEYESRMHSSLADGSESKLDHASEKRPLDDKSHPPGGDKKRSRPRQGSKKHTVEDTNSEPLDYGDDTQEPQAAERPAVSQMPYQSRRIISYDD
ncbi:hypothetical protein N7457_006247 [Penicillium paradoxum]|uniref:uncharacterized protein n=1 Tax=Penicillium paradoxum TaxID=176176 RepID=UPI002547899B|nr:uncharacterized protein N7457_006247 [Penicillium paradoxum]KAJ5781087.1 hypothetical protein N7457_006247 [Penicillium paradoxum]